MLFINSRLCNYATFFDLGIKNIVCNFAKLRITAFILSIIVLVLSCMPCTDGANAMNGKTKQETVKASHQQDSHSQSDACSPFCSCSCCSGTPIPQVLGKLTLVTPEIINSYCSFYSSSVKGISLAIWQPPQLA